MGRITRVKARSQGYKAILAKITSKPRILTSSAKKEFEFQHLQHKLANIGDELPRRIQRYLERIKAITGESFIEAPRKHSNQHTKFTNEAKCIFIGNEFPKVGESGDAFWDRVIVIPHKNKFRESLTYEKNLLSDEQEIEGLILCSLLTVKSLLEHRFTIPSDVEKEEWRRDSDTVRALSRNLSKTVC